MFVWPAAVQPQTICTHMHKWCLSRFCPFIKIINKCVVNCNKCAKVYEMLWWLHLLSYSMTNVVVYALAARNDNGSWVWRVKRCEKASQRIFSMDLIGSTQRSDLEWIIADVIRIAAEDKRSVLLLFFVFVVVCSQFVFSCGDWLEWLTNETVAIYERLGIWC